MILFTYSVFCPVSGSPRELILRLATQRSAAVGDDWNHFTLQENNTWELQYNYRVRCDPDYYGPGCSELWRPRDDQFGHYTCTENGTKQCLDGWTGQFCDQGKIVGPFCMFTSLFHVSTGPYMSVWDQDVSRKALLGPGT